MQTLFEKNNILHEQETVSFEEINNQQATLLPMREELSVINYNIGYPYSGYEGYHSNYNVSNHQVDNHSGHQPDYRVDCYKYEYNNHENVRYDHDYWKHQEGANDRNVVYGRHDNGLHLGQYKNDGYAPYVAYNTYYSAPPSSGYESQPMNTYAGYSGYSNYPTYGYNSSPYGYTYSPYNSYYRA